MYRSVQAGRHHRLVDSMTRSGSSCTCILVTRMYHVLLSCQPPFQRLSEAMSLDQAVTIGDLGMAHALMQKGKPTEERKRRERTKAQ